MLPSEPVGLSGTNSMISETSHFNSLQILTRTSVVTFSSLESFAGVEELILAFFLNQIFSSSYQSTVSTVCCN